MELRAQKKAVGKWVVHAHRHFLRRQGASVASACDRSKASSTWLCMFCKRNNVSLRKRTNNYKCVQTTSLGLGRAPCVSCGVKCIDLASLTWHPLHP